MVQPQVSNYTDGTDAHWEVSKTLKLKQPKSSHTLLLVPRTYASKCKLVNWHNDPVFSREWTTYHTVYTILYYIVTLVVIVPKCLRLQKPTNKSNNSVVKLKTTRIERSTGTSHYEEDVGLLKHDFRVVKSGQFATYNAKECYYKFLKLLEIETKFTLFTQSYRMNIKLVRFYYSTLKSL